MQLSLVQGYYLNDRYVETSRTIVQIDADARGQEILNLARELAWPNHLRAKLSSLFLEAADGEIIDLTIPLSKQNVREGTEVRLRLGLR